jgi:EAL domain-containing protein (putative c-di-GMP-specific phosphodiesterase class I)/predicted transcriptional regulator
MNDIVRKELEYIIDGNHIRSVFQPIVSLRDGKVIGYEALSRISCKCSVINNIEQLFDLAGEYNRLWDLELLCREKSLEAAYIQMKTPFTKKLFLNVNPKVLFDIKFRDGFTRERIKIYNINPENIIFEITEKNAVNDIESFQKVVNHYKIQQYQIAIDDAGSGYSGLNLISDINPHYLKLDMKLIHNIDKDRLKYALVKGMMEFSQNTNISLIAEGIETKEEMKTLVEMGVQYGQGYIIQKPKETLIDINTDIIEYIKELNWRKNYAIGNNLSSLYINTISSKTKIIAPNIITEQVFDEFRKDPSINGMCIVSDERVLGIITRENLESRLSGRYGFSLNQRKEITALMDNEYLEVDYHTPINTVSYLAMERENSKLYDMIVVTKDGKFYGTVTVKDLLQKATEIDVANAKNLNPLSGLPGNHMIEQELFYVIDSHSKYSVMYIDIDNFKAFNDVYGFENGDMVIKILSKVILNNKNISVVYSAFEM